MERQREQALAGKVAIITGASRGVGKQAALDFASRGAHVVLAARTVEADTALPGTIGDTLQQIEDLGGQAIAVATDLAQEEDLTRLVDATKRGLVGRMRAAGRGCASSQHRIHGNAGHGSARHADQLG
jgi:NAD(P)-dependent dehydrogenase (short-subunit alcohol dehydrogenase family)